MGIPESVNLNPKTFWLLFYRHGSFSGERYFSDRGLRVADARVQERQRFRA